MTLSATERAILDLLSDEDEDLHLPTALDTLANVVAGLCLLATGQPPLGLAAEFAEVMQARVAGDDAEPERLLS